ncbi:MAG: SLC13 family permease [Acetobacteraceae bacterium]|nr:SLC13 family permease [Acetobacteraceae bacterium]
MTPEQAIAFGILGATVLLFAWGRLPYDLVALLSLLAAVLTGVVPADRAFTGFGDEVVAIVAGALLVSAAVARSGFVETAIRPLLPRLRTAAVQVPVLAGAVLVLSAVTKNVGALAIFMPVAFQLARRTGTPLSALLMPMSFASLLGGLITLIGTSPNIIVSRVRQEATGQPFGMFDFAPVGLAIAVAGLLVLSLAWRLLPRGQKHQATGSMEAAFTLEDYTTEARIPPGSPMVGKALATLLSRGEGRVRVTAVVRDGRRHPPLSDMSLKAEDRILLVGEPEDLDALVARARLDLAGERQAVPREAAQVVEGVVTAASPLIGQSPAELDLHRRFGINLLAVSRRDESIAQKLSTLRIRAGDVLILKAQAERLPEAMGALRVLPLSERGVSLGRSRRSVIPPLVLAAVMLLLAFGVLPVAIAFLAGAVTLLALRSLTMREAYEAVDWPIIILLGALIPVSEAIRTTGGAELIAGRLSGALQALPPIGALALVMAFAMAVTPFLNNAAAVLVVAPIAVSLAGKLGMSPDAFLMAVAVGAACDFLTPIGHQCNTLVMGPGGYRFGDYWRLGLPLSLTVLAVGVPAIALVWPLGGGGP